MTVATDVQIEATELRSAGVPVRKLTERFGVSKSTILRWTDPEVAERGRRRARDLKRTRYSGTCVDCGARTGYSGKGSTPSERCSACHHAKQAAELRVWTRDKIVAAIRRFAAENGRPPKAMEWMLGNPEKGYPPFAAVFRSSSYPNAVFASWNEAIAAAGFEPTPVGGYKREGFVGIKPRQLEVYETVAEHGPITAKRIAELRGVGVGSTRRSLQYLLTRGLVANERRLRMLGPGPDPFVWEIAA